MEQSFWKLVDEEFSFQETTVEDLLKEPLRPRNEFHPLTRDYAAFSVLEVMANERVRRVPILDSYASRKLVNLITHSQVIHWLEGHFDLIGPKCRKRIGDCPEMFKTVTTVENKDTVIEAFELMVNKNISGVAVVDDDGRLINHISVRDLKLIGVDSGMFWRLQQSVRTFTHHLYTDYVRKYRHVRQIAYVTPEATIGEVIQCLIKHSFHRLYIVSSHEQRQPVGVCSLHDIIRQILA